MKGFEPKWKDLPDYVIGVTKAIWEDRGVGTLNDYYAPDIPVRSPMGITRGNQAVIASTMATINEFPDRELLGEDVIWTGDDDAGYLSSHRLLTKATHTGDGQFGSATGKPWQAYILADCAVKEGVIYDEWLVRDYGGIVRQLGISPRDYAAGLIDREGGAQGANPPFTPATDMDGGYHGTGNDNAWGQHYAATLTRIMDHDFTHIRDSYDRAVIGEYAGANRVTGRDGVVAFWVGLRSSFPHATFKIHHQIGMNADMMPPRAAIRWSLDGVHDGWGSFGEPTGVPVHVMGMCHAEFGPYGPDGVGLRREFALYDEVAIWKQILMQG
jgi:hypothetical protein